MNKYLIKLLITSSWVGIASLSLFYIHGSSVQTQFGVSIGEERFHIPKIDPLIHLDTKSYVLPQQMYNFYNKNIPPNKFLVEKSKKFYSNVGTESYTQVFYRPDFKSFPIETVLIFFFRIFTFLSIALILYLLSKVLSSLLTNNAFNPINQRRFLWIGLLIFLISITRILHSTVLAGFLRYNPTLLGYEVGPSFQSLWLIVVGVLFLIFSFIYGHLISLHEEQKLTV
ncbi:MAG: DUF2975 domain-containing protein [Balneola sp.]